MAMPRHRFNPETASDEQRNAIKQVADAARKADEADGELWAAVEVARDLDVPLTFLADTANRGRATVHRHVQPRKAQP